MSRALVIYFGAKNNMIYIDLTHVLNENTPVYPGSHDTPPHFTPVATIEKDGYSSSILTMGLHVGTHIDAPAHMIRGGNTLDTVPLEKLCCKAFLVDARGHNLIGSELIEPIINPPGNALLFLTGHEAFYGRPEYFTNHPVLTEDAAGCIIEKKFGMVALICKSDHYPFDQHKKLFTHDILIIENLTNLNKLVG